MSADFPFRTPTSGPSGDLYTTKTNFQALDGAVPATKGWTETEANQLRTAVLKIAAAMKDGADYALLKNMAAELPGVAPSGMGRVYAADGKLWTTEDGGNPKVLTREDGVFNIRDYGAKPGSANKVATTAAFTRIFSEITYGYFPTVNGKRNAIIHVPFNADDAWYVNELAGYIGNPGASINFIGEVPAGRAGVGGSTLLYDGADGGTLLDLVAPNASELRHISFHGNRKAKYLVQGRQFWDAAHSFQAGSSGVRVIGCSFAEPRNAYDTVLFAAGKDDDPPNTLQTSEYSFFRCLFQGIDLGAGTKQGWGFKALNAGNTKNFTFDHCNFGSLYRGIECYSGYCLVYNCNGGNIGYDRGDAAMIWVEANVLLIMGGGMENGTPGYHARYAAALQGTLLNMSSVYVAGTAPADDCMVLFGGASKLTGCDLVNSRTIANEIPWSASEAVVVGQLRTNDSGKLYEVITAGTTAGSGGPTGTGSNITDGTAHWKYRTATDGNEARLAGVFLESAGWGGISIEHCAFPYITTPLKGVPIYDNGANLNPISGVLGKGNTDYGKNVAHKIRAHSNSTGLFGSNINEQLPDFRGTDEIVLRDQFWTNNNAAGLLVVRNANGVYVVDVPASVIAAAATDHLTLCQPPPYTTKFKITEVLLEVTTPLSGPGVSAITASIGTDLTAEDGLLLAQDVSTGVANYGINPAQLGADMANGRYIPSASHPRIVLKVNVGGGAAASINAGSLRIILEGKRLGV